MEPGYKLLFEGRLDPNIPQEKIRLKLLDFYKGRQDIADRFFTGRSLIISKGLDVEKARRLKAMLAKAGVPCRIVEEPSYPGRGPGDRARTGLRGSRLQNAMALVLILLIIISSAVRIFALRDARTIYPPDRVAANSGEICVHFNKTLFFLNPEGALKRQVPLIALGIRSKPADMQLLGNGDLIIGDRDKGEIMRCSDTGLSCRKIGPALEYVIGENFSFLADERRNLLFISDTGKHALLVQDLDGTYIRSVESRSPIAFPNGLALDRDGVLWLSNTAKKEVISFARSENGFVQTDRTVSLQPQPGKDIQGLEQTKRESGTDLQSLKDFLKKIRDLKKIRGQMGDDLVHIRPLSVAWDSQGNLWVAASNGMITSAGVRVFDSDGKQIARVPLGKGALPVSLAASGDRVLIADSKSFQFFSASPGSFEPVPFGNAAFQRELSKVRERFLRYNAVGRWAGLGILLLALGTAVLVLVIIVQNRGKRESRRVRASGSAAHSGTPTGLPVKYRLEFTGSGEEYFRIWIVNVFLTILTLGIYGAWAKVRTRKYFYRNTILDGHPFDYTADPKALLRGYGIVAAGLGLYYLAKYFNPLYGLAVFSAFALVIPLLVYKSLRFFAYNSTYRNIKFRFIGSAGESYRTYLFLPLLVPFTLGLIIPYWTFRKKKYFFKNFCYGASANRFGGTHGPFYRKYVKGMLIPSGLPVVAMFVIVPLTAGASILGKGSFLGAGLLISILSAYGLFLLGASFFQMYIYAWTTNYCFGQSGLGKIAFESTLDGIRLFWIRVSNIAAIVFSLGLLTPWAKVRRMRYIVDNLCIVAQQDLNDFTAGSGVEESSIGDAATEFFGMEIGL